MKIRLAAAAALALVATAGCGQDPRVAALQQEMQAAMQQIAAMGASPEQMAALQTQMAAKMQALQTTLIAEQSAGMMPGGYAEPTEAEMRSVFESKFDNVKSRVNSMESQCANVRGSNDPMVGLACLAGMAGNSQYAQVGMSSFRKIACEKSSKPGYNCDYIIGVSARALGAFGGGGSEAKTGRFVKSDGRWIVMDY